jgi:glycosyltransferase involved in cell wall biosynthesis
MNFNLEVPINNLSFGQVSFGILHEIFNRKLMPNIFPIGQVDLSAFNLSQDFVNWLQFCVNKSKTFYSREFTSIKLWHIFDSERTISKKNILYTFHETDQFTPTEVNIMRNTDTILFSSEYATNIAKKFGVKNVDTCHPYVDTMHVFKTEVPMVDAINFSLIGKFEKRKHTAKILQIWASLFGNNPRFRLNCLIFNPFIENEKMNEIINQIFNGNIPWNINFLPRFQKNEQVNFVMNSCDIDLSGLSGAEGFNLPCFNMLSLDKISVVLKAHAHTDFIEGTNAVLVEPKGKIPIYDGAFFVQGNPANQGNMFDFDENEAAKAMQEAVNIKINSNKRLTSNLISRFSVSNTVDKLLSYI